MGIKPEQWDKESLSIAMANANKADKLRFNRDNVERHEPPEALKEIVAEGEITIKKQGRPKGSKNKKRVKASQSTGNRKKNKVGEHKASQD